MVEIPTFYYDGVQFVLDHYSFAGTGESNGIELDLVGDIGQGMGIPAKSLLIENFGGGSVGTNLIYFRTSPDGSKWSKPKYIAANRMIGFTQDDALIFYKVFLWATSTGCEASVTATPGVWTEAELKYRGFNLATS